MYLVMPALRCDQGFELKFLNIASLMKKLENSYRTKIFSYRSCHLMVKDGS